MKWQAISDRLCLLRIKGWFYNYTIPNVHCPHEGRPDAEKETFYAQLEKLYDSCSRRDIKIVIGDMNGRKDLYKPVIGPHSLYTVTNDNGQLCTNFAASHGLAVQSPFFPRPTYSKTIDHVLIDGPFFSDITYVRTNHSADRT